jgi:transcriptional regulator with XRE-family HTH domain
METYRPPLHHVLKDRRIELGLSQTLLGERTGLGQSHISKIERGMVTPEPPTIKLLAFALGLDPVPLLMLAEEWLDRERAVQREAKLTADLKRAEALPANTPRGRLVRLVARLTDQDAAFIAEKVVGPIVAAYGRDERVENTG